MRFLAKDGNAAHNDTLLVSTSQNTGGWIISLLGAADSSGKHYFEVEQQTASGYMKAGLYKISATLNSSYWYIDDYRGGCYASPGGTVSTPAYSSAAGVRLMVAYDMTAGKVWFGVNGVWLNSGNPAAGTSPIYSNLAGYTVHPGVEQIKLQTCRFYVQPSDWLYAPAGFSPPTEMAMSGVNIAAPLISNEFFGGSLVVIEPVTVTGIPAWRKVRLHDQQTGQLVREQWSDPTTGLVTFSGLTTGPWLLVSIDHTGEFQAVAISDRLATLTGERV